MGQIYIFECYPMPWTEIDLEVPIGERGNHSFDIPQELTDEELKALVDMMCWAWNNEWFEHSTSETVCSELLQKFLPGLYERICVQVHSQFCNKYPNSENVSGFGEYEIFPPDEVNQMAREKYNSSYQD